MRVAFLQAWLTIGGAERIVQAVVERIDRSLIEPVIVNLYEPGAVGEELERAGHHSISRIVGSRWDLRTGSRLARLWKRERIDVVHVYDSALPMFWAGLVRRIGGRPPLVLGFHSTGKLGDPLQHLLANRMTIGIADQFVALGSRHLEFLARTLGVPVDRSRVISTGVDLARFMPAQDRRAERRALGLPEDAVLVALVAALRPEKHHRLFVDAARRAHEISPGTRFLIIGEGPERPAIEAAITAAGLGEVVQMLGARTDMDRLWPLIDIAALTSHPVVETLPVTLLEAHACGVPAVATDVGSVSDIVSEGVTGHLVQAGDAAAFAHRIVQLASDADARHRAGLAARQRAEHLFAVGGMVRKYEELFLEVAGRSGRSR